MIGANGLAPASPSISGLPENAVIVAFEGPDRYSSIGGLGTRVTALARALGEHGVKTELIFAGDPAFKPVEPGGANLTLRRWSGWISQFHPRNAYDGEEEKIRDFDASVPDWIAENVVGPAKDRGERVVVFLEDWQTANVAVLLDRILRERGIREAATLLWNANNTYGFHRIDWHALKTATQITAVSKYMKFELALVGVGALVIPNGIHPGILDGPGQHLVAALKAQFKGKPMLCKVGRFDPDKNWLQAMDAVAELRREGHDARLIVRGGKEEYGEVVFGRAREQGLVVERVAYEGDDIDELAAAIGRSQGHVIHLRAFLSEETLFALYAACDAVLANSGKEPFGLVGLEVMAAGGIAVCGATGEEYAEPFVNAIVCDTNDGRELATYLQTISEDHDAAEKMRAAGYATASRYTWGNVLTTLGRKLRYLEHPA